MRCSNRIGPPARGSLSSCMATVDPVRERVLDEAFLTYGFSPMLDD